MTRRCARNLSRATRAILVAPCLAALLSWRSAHLMRRTPIGVSGLYRQKQEQESFRSAGQALSESQMAQIKDQLAAFRQHLENFALKYRKQIRSDPIFRHSFCSMCSQLGVDPLASSRGLWSKWLGGYTEFYYELGLALVETAMSYASPLVPLESLLTALSKRKGHVQLLPADLLTALDSLGPLGHGYRVVEIGRVQYVQSSPTHLHPDHHALLALFQSRQSLAQTDIIRFLHWTLEKAQACLSFMIEEGIVWIDYQAEPVSYWMLAGRT